MYDYQAIMGLFSTFWLLGVIWVVLKVVAGWRIFAKAGQPGWASIVPFYNSYIEFKIYWGNGWLFLVPLVLSVAAAGIPVFSTLFTLLAAIIAIITKYRQSVAFGQGIGFTIGLVLLDPIFSMILGFGSYEYLGIPKDGYSYDELVDKYNNYRAAHPKQEITYEQPAPSKDHPNVSYEQPDAQPHEGPIYAQTTQPEGTPTTDNSDTTPQA